MFIASSLALLLAPLVLTADISDGETITRTRTIKVRVQSESIVNQVELYVDDELRGNATATPYTFKLDPLNEKDGPLKLTFTAYAASGDKGTKSIRVKIDTGVSKGAEANTTQAQDYLVQSKWDEAIDSARVALKVNPDYRPAKVVLVKAFLRKGVYDKAQQFADGLLRAEPENPENLELQSAVQLQRAFNTYSTSTDKQATLMNISRALTSAVDSRRKVLDYEFSKLAPPTESTLVQYADGAIRTGHYSAAISALTPTFNATFRTDLGNRIAYSQLRLGRHDDLTRTLGLMEKERKLDHYGYAMAAASAQYQSNDKKADELIKEAISLAPTDIAVRLAQLYIAQHRNNTDVMAPLAQSLANDEGHRTEVNYYLSVVYDRLKKYDESDKAYRTAVFAEPFNYPMYVERATEALGRAYVTTYLETEKAKHELEVAEVMCNAALTAKPDSPEALTGRALTLLLKEKIDEAVKVADAAVTARPGYAPGHYVAGFVFSKAQHKLDSQVAELRKDAGSYMDAETRAKIAKTQEESRGFRDRSNKEFREAEKADPKYLGNVGLPDLAQVFRYYYRSGQMPLLTAPR